MKKPKKTEHHLRDDAEKKLSESSDTFTKIKSKMPEELVHELQIHQIELEMMNDELRMTNLALESARDRYVKLYDSAPVGYFTFTHEALISEVNLTGTFMLGVDRRKLVNNRFRAFVSSQDFDLWDSHFMKVLKEGGKQSCDLSIRRVDDSVFYARLDSIRTDSDDENPLIRCAMSDITEKKQIEEMLRQNVERYRTFVETMNDGCIVVNQNMTLVYVNDQFCRTSGYKKEELIGKSISYYFDEEYQRIIREQAMNREDRQFGSYEVDITRKDGSKKIASISARPIFDSENSFQGSFAVITDITLRKETEKMLAIEHQTMKQQTMIDIDNLNKEIQGYNHALKVLLKNAKEDQKTVEENVVSNVREMIAPFLNKLKNTRLNEKQKNFLDVVETNLNNIVSPFISTLKAEMRDFTPAEIHVAALIREGRTNKDVADILMISDNTVMFHRTNIRRKLGLQGQKSNLRTYLLSLNQ